MKKNDIEEYLSKALKKELETFQPPSPQLRERLLISAPRRVKKLVWRTALGFVSTAIIILFICVKQDKPVIVDECFKPTRVVDLIEISFEPTKVINHEN